MSRDNSNANVGHDRCRHGHVGTRLIYILKGYFVKYTYLATKLIWFDSTCWFSSS